MEYKNEKSRSADFICQTLTFDGEALMVKVLAGDTILKFTKLKIGNGEQQADMSLKNLTDLINPLTEVSIKDIERNQNNVIIKSNNYFNSDIVEDVYWNELGIYAEDPDDGEILFAVLNSPDIIEYIPAATSGISIENDFAVMLLISSDVEVSAVIKSIQYATKDELEEHIKAKNPHKVSADDVGLGNVKNVLFSENEVEFTTGQTLVNFKQKDTLKKIISTCWSAIDKLIKHIDPAKTNPHKTTFEDIKSDTGWKKITIASESKNYFTNNPDYSFPMQYRKLNGVVYLQGAISVSSKYDDTSRIICRLPDGYKPLFTQGSLPISAANGLQSISYLYLTPNGELYLQFNRDSNFKRIKGSVGWVGFSISFPAK